MLLSKFLAYFGYPIVISESLISESLISESLVLAYIGYPIVISESCQRVLVAGFDRRLVMSQCN